MTSSKSFSLLKDLDHRQLRYYLHKLEELKNIDPILFKKVVEGEKRYRKTLTLSDKEQDILDKYGKASGLYLNYIILVDSDEQ